MVRCDGRWMMGDGRWTTLGLGCDGTASGRMSQSERGCDDGRTGWPLRCPDAYILVHLLHTHLHPPAFESVDDSDHLTCLRLDSARCPHSEPGNGNHVAPLFASAFRLLALLKSRAMREGGQGAT
jgi:hypothetical protein